MNNVAVIMSTYNGEKYLREQLDSILAQKDVNISLFVRDDCSSDGTKSILIEYSKKYNNINVEFGQNVGVGNSFMNALYSVPDSYDYYAFADQDDIWLSNKLYEAITMLESSKNSLYASNQECVDSVGNTIKIRYDDTDKINLNPVSILQKNMLSGCTMVFNNELYKILVDLSHRPSSELLHNRIHDVWVAFVASLFGGIIYDKRAFIKYRQHDNNVVGIKKKRGERLKKLKNKKLRNGRSMLAKEALVKFPSVVNDNPLLVDFSNAQKCKRKIIKHIGEITQYSDESRLGLFIKIIMGWF